MIPFGSPPNCDHICHTRGLNPWVYECPTCGCENPKYDPEAESDIDIGQRHDFLGGLLGVMQQMGARPVRLRDDLEPRDIARQPHERVPGEK